MRRLRYSWLLLLGWLSLTGLALGYGYQYMKEHREEADREAQKIFVTPNEIIAQIYQTVGPISSEAQNEEYCLKKIKRRAVREKGDGIIAFKTRELSPGHWRCEGILVRLIAGGEGVPVKIKNEKP